MASAAELVAKRTIALMRRRTLPGCAKPWDSEASRAVIAERLRGVDEADLPEVEADLAELVEGAAELVAAGRQPRWSWSIANLFGSSTFERWRTDVASYRLELERVGRVQRARAVDDAAERATAAGADNVVAIPVDLEPELQSLVSRFEKETGTRLPRKSDPKQLDLLGRAR